MQAQMGFYVSRSLSVSSVSSVSSATSSSSSVHSVDSDDMYADLASPVSSASSRSPTPAQTKKEKGTGAPCVLAIVAPQERQALHGRRVHVASVSTVCRQELGGLPVLSLRTCCLLDNAPLHQVALGKPLCGIGDLDGAFFYQQENLKKKMALKRISGKGTHPHSHPNPQNLPQAVNPPSSPQPYSRHPPGSPSRVHLWHTRRSS